MYENVVISGTGIYYPKENAMEYDKIVNHFKSLDIEVEGLLKHLGKKVRFIADSSETPITLAHKAAVIALDSANLEIKDIDMIVVSTDTPEYNVPSNAIKLSKSLNAKETHIAFDINGNCAGGIIAMDQVSSYLKTHKHIKRALIVGVFMGSHIHKETDPISYSIFSDGAGAVILEKKEENFERGFIDSQYNSNSDYHNMNSFPKLGFSNILKNNVKEDEHLKLYVNPEIQLSFVPDVWVGIISTLLERNNLTSGDIDMYIFSQFSLFDITSTIDRLSVNHDKFIYTGDKYGYTGSSSPIFALNHTLKEQDYNKYSTAVFCGIGAGYSSASLLYKF